MTTDIRAIADRLENMDATSLSNDSLADLANSDNNNGFNYGETFINQAGSNMSMGNLSAGSSAVSFNYPLPFMIIVAVLLLCLILVTAFGNLLVGLALFKFHNLRTVSNCLIGNLALSDFLLATTILPLSAVYECLGYWVFGPIFCYFWLCIDVLYCTASIWNLCIIAFDRFTATLYPVWYRERRNARQAAVYIAIVWLVSILICLPPVLGWNDIVGSYKFDNETAAYQCLPFIAPSYVLFSASGSFFIPFFITVFLYIRIFMVLRLRMNRMRASRAAQNRAQNRPPDPPKTQLNIPGQNEIELNQVPNASFHTEELSFYGSDSGNDNEPAANLKSDNPTYVSSSDPEGPSANANILRNGTRDKASEKDKDTLVILNPQHNLSESEKDSDRDNIQIVITEANSDAIKSTAELEDTNKNEKNCLTLAQPKQLENKRGRRSITNAIRNVNPFGKREKTKPTEVQRNQRRRNDQREVRATIRMAVIIGCFCLCWVGFFIVYVVRAFCPNCYIPRTLDTFLFWLGYSNSSMNPILYAIFNEEFRRAFQKLLGCYQRKKPRF